MSRPFDLDPLFRALSVLPGVGPRTAKLVEKLCGGPKVLDLLFHRPADFIDRSYAPPVSDAEDGRIATMALRIDKHVPNSRKSLPYRVHCMDESGKITLVFFHANKAWVEKQLPVGETRIISGKVEYYQGNPQIVHPDNIVKPDEKDLIESVDPIYPLTQGVTNKKIRAAIKAGLEFVKPMAEWQDSAYLKQQKWPSFHEAIHNLHHPETASALEPMSPARARLAYDEMLANQLTLALVRMRQRKIGGRAFTGNGDFRAKIIAALPFTLTGAQERSLADIDTDMRDGSKMLRLLQGDVGSGKTVVAALAMAAAVETGAQAAMMAPTEILARQHYETLKPMLEAAGIHCVILTGRDKGKARDAILDEIKSGAAQVVLGTHAIFQDGVDYADLGLAVIDEQHRFGVHQRLQLSSKGRGTDMLVMTATPIPRTLTLTAYGDMDVSRLDEKPPGRKPIDTRLIPKDKMENMIAGLRRQIETGARVYWVCPLVEESEVMDLAAAEERYDVLKHFFGDRIGLVHGRMKGAEKDDVMQKFAAGDLDILVATTVIEVGVNVPEATIMVIEHAERFGLSQLHQLRGRVGRGGDQSYCFLLYAAPLGETAKARLSMMRESEDGFLIAEKDLELRGAGDVLGVAQSGLPRFRLADLEAHAELIAAARDDAMLILEKDATLKSDRGQALKTLLYLFERDQAIQYLQSG